MARIEIPMMAKYQRPIIKLYNKQTLIDTGAVIPMLSMDADDIEARFSAEKLLIGHTVGGIGGSSRGDVYRLGEFKVGDITYAPFDAFVPYEPSIKYPILLGAPLFYGMFYGFDTVNSKFIIETNNVPLTRKFELRELHGQLYPQIDGIFVQDTTLFLSDMLCGI